MHASAFSPRPIYHTLSHFYIAFKGGHVEIFTRRSGKNSCHKPKNLDFATTPVPSNAKLSIATNGDGLTFLAKNHIVG